MATNGTTPHDEQGWNLTRHPDEEVLSAYLDRQLEPAVRREVAAHLSDCAACRRQLHELRAVATLLSELPAVAPRRSFALTPRLLEQRQPRILQWLPRLRVVTAVAATFLILTLAGDLYVQSIQEQPTAEQVAPAAAPAADQAVPASAGADRARGEGLPEASNQEERQPAALPRPQQARGPAAAAPQGATVVPATRAASAPAAAGAPAPTVAAAQAETAADTSDKASALTAGTPEVGPGEQAPAVRERAGEISTFPWRVIEITLGLVVLALLVTIVVVPRLVRR